MNEAFYPHFTKSLEGKVTRIFREDKPPKMISSFSEGTLPLSPLEITPIEPQFRKLANCWEPIQDCLQKINF